MLKNAAITFDATNLTDSLHGAYYEFGGQGTDETTSDGRSIIGRTFALGVRYSFN